MMTTTNTAPTYSLLVICRADGSDRLICDEGEGVITADLERVRTAAEYVGIPASEVCYFVAVGTTRALPDAHGMDLPADLASLVEAN